MLEHPDREAVEDEPQVERRPLGVVGALAAAGRDVDDPPAELVLPAGHRRPQELDAQVPRVAADEGELDDGVGHRLLVEREHLHDDLDRPLPGRQ
ncbi:hypothetical protein MTQ16_07270 [Corynebacterium bovis]